MPHRNRGRPAAAPLPPRRTRGSPQADAPSRPASPWACPASCSRTSRPSACWPNPRCRSGSDSTAASRRRSLGASSDRGRRRTSSVGTARCALPRRRSKTGRPIHTGRWGTSSWSGSCRSRFLACSGRWGCTERRARPRANLEEEYCLASVSPMLQTPLRTSSSRWCRGNTSD